MLDKSTEEELVSILVKECKINQKLLNLGQEKKKVIKAEEIDRLEEIVEQEEQLLEKLAMMEEKRQDLLDGSALSEIIDSVDEELAEKLTKLRNRLVVVIEELAHVSHLNSNLIQDSLKITNFNLQLLTNDHGQGTYDKSGSDDSQPGRSIINHKA